MKSLSAYHKEHYLFNSFVETISCAQWRRIYRAVFSTPTYDEKRQLIIAGPKTYRFTPSTCPVVSYNGRWLSYSKFEAMFNWYKKADPTDDSIIEYFSEYKDCISPTHPVFRSNYGVYMYAESGLYKCYNELVNNSLSRRACVVINDRAVMQNDGEIDKLCTNAIHYFIDGKYLNCVVQMRSSDMATLLPYDAFMFSVFFVELWQMLKSHYAWLQPGCITMQVANAHFSFGKVPQRCYDTSIIMHDVDLLSLVASMKASFADNLRTFYI